MRLGRRGRRRRCLRPRRAGGGPDRHPARRPRRRPNDHPAHRPARHHPPCPPTPSKQTKLGEDPDWEYGTFTTNTATGQVQWLDARYRTQAHVEDRIKQFKACGARTLPSINYDRNAAWLQLAALATSLTAWLRHLALNGDLAKATTRPCGSGSCPPLPASSPTPDARPSKSHPARHGPTS
jgi:hypothetical protein